ncbi:DNA polymerase III subunit gamma/tau [Usitatibacter palustris]|uniref:DNA polymerase III subunit gamma/tau n=1 Tax=Usitatibacter palustris TaxID=2732487 RepID=A0A6M4H5Z3_9PROT|nr:DNA polymerase III subunit gamma/tau [Usitatibacter palustris]QJR14605.1 Holliday junction ATP-dependent DNA helicase RuvB [Usitatibacter palustris]
MTYQVLARKWRPRAFEELVGQAHVVTALANALASKRLHHAYLFTGTRGVGKTTLARILAKALNCETGITPKPCGKCGACTQIDSGRFVDLLEVDAATNTKVDEMRELLENAQYMPTVGRFKIYIIDEVHMLSKSAFNSMLKTLEEPPEHVKFILATTDPQRLPVTVLSRCLQFNLKPLAPPVIAGHLKRVLEAEGIPFEDAALAHLSKAAAGSVRDSLSLLDQAIAHGGGRVAAAQVAEMLGSVGGDLVWPLLECVVAGDGPGAMREAERIAGRSIDFDTALEDLASLLHRIALVLAGIDPPADESDTPRLKAIAARLDNSRVQVLYQIAVLGRRDLPLAPDEFAGFSMSVLRMLSFSGGNAEGRSVARPTPAVAAPTPSRSAAPVAAAVNVPAAPAPARATSAPVASEPVAAIPFDGDWPAFVARLQLTGMAGLLARYGELASFNNNNLELVVPEAHRAYSERNYQDKLKAELAKHFGANFRLTVKTGATSGVSLAAVREKQSEERQATAATAIEADPFVRDLVRDMGAEVVPSSIRPSGNDNGPTS